jgi:uncharacterized SAM-binding protein YcdF (DUF218 family)
MEHVVSFGFLAVPTIFISLSLLGALLALRWRRIGVALALLSSLCLFVAATPAMSSFLLHQVEAGLPRGDVDLHAAQAIVVLGGDERLGNGRDIPDRLGRETLERVVYAAAAYRRLRLPIAVSGGPPVRGHPSQGAQMQTALKQEFDVPVAWNEDHSQTTWENAVDVARLLRPAGLTRVVLVTDAWHLPRALWAFEEAGLEPLPWPAPRDALQLDRPRDYVPDLHALCDSFAALHELIGGVYYRLRH